LIDDGLLRTFLISPPYQVSVRPLARSPASSTPVSQNKQPLIYQQRAAAAAPRRSSEANFIFCASASTRSQIAAEKKFAGATAHPRGIR
jgi:hypothetical protein